MQIKQNLINILQEPFVYRGSVTDLSRIIYELIMGVVLASGITQLS